MTCYILTTEQIDEMIELARRPPADLMTRVQNTDTKHRARCFRRGIRNTFLRTLKETGRLQTGTVTETEAPSFGDV